MCSFRYGGNVMASNKKIKAALLVAFTILISGWMFSATISTALGVTADIENVFPDVIANAKPDEFVGSATCKACHEDQFKDLAKTVHGKAAASSKWKGNAESCESCHGAGKAHVENGGDKTKIINFKDRSAKENSESCLACHSQTSAHATWRGSKHESAGLSCLDCHSVHHSPGSIAAEIAPYANLDGETKLLKKKTESETCYQCHTDVRKSEFQRSTHLFKNENRESKMTCSSCHDSHGSIGEKLMKTATINETCYTCHAEKRGPFLWEHAPARENCTNCHKSHGSNHTSLLKARSPMLCQQCHMQGRHQTVAGKPNSVFMSNRGCLNCHAKVHGSNHPSGINLQR